MKTREIKALHTKSVAELRTQLAEAKQSLTTSRLENAQRKLTNTTGLTNLRHDIARLQTILRMKIQSTAAVESVDDKAVADKGGVK